MGLFAIHRRALDWGGEADIALWWSSKTLSIFFISNQTTHRVQVHPRVCQIIKTIFLIIFIWRNHWIPMEYHKKSTICLILKLAKLLKSTRLCTTWTSACAFSESGLKDPQDQVILYRVIYRRLFFVPLENHECNTYNCTKNDFDFSPGNLMWEPFWKWNRILTHWDRKCPPSWCWSRTTWRCRWWIRWQNIRKTCFLTKCYNFNITCKCSE